MHTCLGIKIFQGDLLRGLFFIYNGGNLHFSFGFGGNFVSALFFFCQIIVYVVDPIIVEEKGGGGSLFCRTDSSSASVIF